MPYGSTNGGDGPAGGGETPPTQQQRAAARLGTVKERVHSLSYSETVNKLLLDIDATQTEGSVKADAVGDVEIKNTGGTPAFAILAYRLWTTEGLMSTESDGATNTGVYHVHHLLKPGQSMFIPDCPAIISDAEVTQFDGTATVENLAPDSNEYTDSTAKTTEGFADDDDTTITFDDASGGSAGPMFRVNDLIRLDNEICRIISLTDTVFTVERAVHGTAKADHTNNTAIRFPFFNAYHDFDKYSVAQTDTSGRFKCFNFFGQGRTFTGIQGITPGSVAIKFYEAGYQSLGLSGITASTNSGLTAGETLKLDITVDGGTLFQDLTFAVDSSNTNFGGTNGVISKIQDALDTQYYTAGNLFEKRVYVGIVDGDIRFTSGQRLSTSAILLADTGDSDTLIDAAANGRIPASGNIPSAVAARLPDDVTYDKVTYIQTPNTGVFAYDDGMGKLFGMCSGTINYETGAIDMIGCPVNAEFVVTCLHTSPFSGKQDATNTTKMNKLKHIYGNVPNQKWNGELTITRY